MHPIRFSISFIKLMVLDPIPIPNGKLTFLLFLPCLKGPYYNGFDRLI
jgi:hypothetical protein